MRDDYWRSGSSSGSRLDAALEFDRSSRSGSRADAWQDESDHDWNLSAGNFGYAGDEYDTPNEYSRSTSGRGTHSVLSDGAVPFLNGDISYAGTLRSGLRVDSQTSSCEDLVLDLRLVESDYGSHFDQDLFLKGDGSTLDDYVKLEFDADY